MDINDKTIQALATSLNFRTARQELISSNIANSETPGYKAKVIDFEESLQRALDIDGKMGMNSNDNRHFNVGGGGFGTLHPEVYDDSNGEVSDDGNTVDAEKEQVKMAENKMLYDASVQLLNKKLGMLKYTINNEK